MFSAGNSSLRVAVPHSVDGSGIGEAIRAELEALGHSPVIFPLDGLPPDGSDAVFLFGPFGKFLHIPEQLARRKREQRPLFIYWNTEGLPDLRIPRRTAAWLGGVRSWMGRVQNSSTPLLRKAASMPPVSLVDHRFLRFRYLGDYLYAHRKGWIDVFADISDVYAGYFSQYGLPAIHAPFGSFEEWYDDLRLDRDIDVLWMGKRATGRRSTALDRIRSQLQEHGVDIYMVDNVEHPFAYGEDRTRLLNRAKITINLLRTWYDENSLRMCLAAPNRSLVVSEPLLPHVPQYRAGVHYISASIESMADTILYYLEHEDKRLQIVDNAYHLLTEEMTFSRSIGNIMAAAGKADGVLSHAGISRAVFREREPVR